MVGVVNRGVGVRAKVDYSMTSFLQLFYNTLLIVESGVVAANGKFHGLGFWVEINAYGAKIRVERKLITTSLARVFRPV